MDVTGVTSKAAVAHWILKLASAVRELKFEAHIDSVILCNYTQFSLSQLHFCVCAASSSSTGSTLPTHEPPSPPEPQASFEGITLGLVIGGVLLLTVAILSVVLVTISVSCISGWSLLC